MIPGSNIQPYLQLSRQFQTEPAQLQVTLYKSWTEIALAVNARTIGTYSTFQVVTGNQYENPDDILHPRQSYRQIFNVASILNGTTAIPLDPSITSPPCIPVNLYGAATREGVQSVPLEHINVAAPADSIALDVNWTTSPPQIEIKTTTANWTAYSAIIVFEYLLN